MTTKEKADAAAQHAAHLVSMAEDAVEAAGRRVAVAEEHLAQAREQQQDAIQTFENLRVEQTGWEKVAASFADEAVTATAHDAGVLTESN